jgi:hypothetical protein
MSQIFTIFVKNDFMAKFIPTIDESGNTTYFTDQVRKRGLELEDRVDSYLKSMHIQYKRNRQNGIDFVIEGHMYMDCVAQGVAGSIGDKLPTKCFKYIKRYSLKQIYILHPYCPISQTVAEHLEHLEKTLDCVIHILDWADFTYLMNGGKFEKRKAYNPVRDNVSVINSKTNTIKLNKFFKFK